LLADNLTRTISVYIPKDIIKYNFTRNKTIPIIYIGVLTRSITVFIPKNITRVRRQPKNIIKFHNVNDKFKPFSEVGNRESVAGSSIAPPYGKEDYYAPLMAVTYVITILILIFFYTFLLNFLPIEYWPITILNIKKSLAIFVSTLISSSFLICISLLPFNVVYCSDGNEDRDSLESGQITPTQAKPSGESSNNESSGEATPKANKENKLNLGEANNKLEKNSTSFSLAGVGTVPDPGEVCQIFKNQRIWKITLNMKKY
jgi:hypothetical protein